MRPLLFMWTRTRLGLVVATLSAIVACTGASPEPTASGLTGSIRVAGAGGDGEIKALRDVVNAFRDGHPGANVELETVAGAGELISKLTTAFLAGNAPDVFVLNYRRLGGFAARGVIEPVVGVDTSLLYPKLLSAFTFEGKLLCLPSNAASMVVYVNTALFARAGIAAPKRGWTWDDMLATARALRAKGISAVGFETSLIRLAPFVWSAGGEVVDDSERPTVVDLSSDPAREALAFMLSLQATGQTATDRAAQHPEEAFAAGKIAMYLDSRRAVPSFRKTSGLSFDVAPVPAKTSAVSVLHSDGYCVTKASTNKALARAFAAFAVTGDGARILAESGRTVPAVRSIAGGREFLATDKQPASSQVFLDQLATVRSLPHSPTWNEAEEAVEQVLQQYFALRMSIDRAVAEIAARTKRELAKA